MVVKSEKGRAVKGKAKALPSSHGQVCKPLTQHCLYSSSISSACVDAKAWRWVSRLKASVKLQTMWKLSSHRSPTTIALCCRSALSVDLVPLSTTVVLFCRAASFVQVFTSMSQSAAFFPDWLISLFQERSRAFVHVIRGVRLGTADVSWAFPPARKISRIFWTNGRSQQLWERNCHAEQLIYGR